MYCNKIKLQGPTQQFVNAGNKRRTRLCSLKTHVIRTSVKQEPEETEIKKVEGNFKPPPLPEPEVLPDLLHRWSLSKGEELFFMQLPDSLPGQPPTTEHKPVKTEVQSADGQSVLLKTEPQVDAAVVLYRLNIR